MPKTRIDELRNESEEKDNNFRVQDICKNPLNPDNMRFILRKLVGPDHRSRLTHHANAEINQIASACDLQYQKSSGRRSYERRHAEDRKRNMPHHPGRASG